jgi:HEAT repeat protein
MKLWKRPPPDIDALQERKDVSGLIRALSHQDLTVQWKASEALVKLGPEHMETLIRALRTRNKDIRLGVLEVLGSIGDHRAVPSLLPILQEKSNEVRLQAALALGEIGAKESIPPLTALLRDRDKYVRYGASLALRRMEWTPEQPADRALLHLGQQEWDQLRGLGPSAIPALSLALNDSDAKVRERAVELLGAIGGEASLSPVYRSLRDEDDQVRWKGVLAAPNCDLSLHYIPRGLRRRPRKRKSPEAAAILNFVLPGIGYTYLGKWWGFLIFQADITLTIFVFNYIDTMVAYIILFPAYGVLAIHAAMMAKKMPELS